MFWYGRNTHNGHVTISHLLILAGIPPLQSRHLNFIACDLFNSRVSHFCTIPLDVLFKYLNVCLIAIFMPLVYLSSCQLACLPFHLNTLWAQTPLRKCAPHLQTVSLICGQHDFPSFHNPDKGKHIRSGLAIRVSGNGQTHWHYISCMA